MEKMNGFEQPLNEPEKPTRFSVVESGERQNNGKEKIEQRSLDVFPLPKTIPGTPEKQRAFEAAWTTVKSNEQRLFPAFLKGLEHRSNGGAIQLARIQNFLTKQCMELSDSEIDSVISHFTTELNRWYANHRNEFPLSDIIDRNLRTTNGQAEGIKTAVHYMRNRAAKIESEGKDISFGFDNDLDVHYKIDVIELVHSDDNGLTIQEMNLVQLKNRPPTEEEQEKILKDHTAWAMDRVLTYEDYERITHIHTNTEGPKEFEKIMNDRTQLQLALIDALTSSEPFSPKILLEKIGLGELANFERAIMLLDYTKQFVSEINFIENEGVIDSKWGNILKEAYVELAGEFARKAGLPVKTAPIKKISSIVATGNKIVQKTVLYEKDDSESAKIAAYA